MDKEQELTPKESLELISNAIAQAKKNVQKGGSFQILWWGWIISVANLGHYALAKMDYAAPYIVWLLVVPGVIVSSAQGFRMMKHSRVSSHVDKVYSKIWIAAFVGIMTSVVFMVKLSYNHNPVILIIAAVAMYTTGQLLRFRPVIIGAVVLWVAALVGFNVNVVDQYLVGGIAIILGYLVPGYMLKRAEH